MPETTTEQERFACSSLGRDVSITRTMNIHRNNVGEIDARTTRKLDCDSRRSCAVGLLPGGFDWSKCVHPELGRAG